MFEYGDPECFEGFACFQRANPQTKTNQTKTMVTLYFALYCYLEIKIIEPHRASFFSSSRSFHHEKRRPRIQSYPSLLSSFTL
jgi:hypothetical protein